MSEHLGDDFGGAARRTDPETSHAAAADVDATKLRRLFAEAVDEAGDFGATTDEVWQSHPHERLNSLSPRPNELRRLGTIRVKTDRNGDQVTRPGRSRSRQLVYVTRKPEEPFDIVESSLGDYINDGDGKLFYDRFSQVIHEFRAARPGPICVEDIVAAAVAVIGDYLTAVIGDGSDTQVARQVNIELREIKDWVRQRIEFVRTQKASPHES